MINIQNEDFFTLRAKTICVQFFFHFSELTYSSSIQAANRSYRFYSFLKGKKSCEIKPQNLTTKLENPLSENNSQILI